jgi:hypothetical protein
VEQLVEQLGRGRELPVQPAPTVRLAAQVPRQGAVPQEPQREAAARQERPRAVVALREVPLVGQPEAAVRMARRIRARAAALLADVREGPRHHIAWERAREDHQRFPVRCKPVLAIMSDSTDEEMSERFKDTV